MSQPERRRSNEDGSTLKPFAINANVSRLAEVCPLATLNSVFLLTPVRRASSFIGKRRLAANSRKFPATLSLSCPLVTGVSIQGV